MLHFLLYCVAVLLRELAGWVLSFPRYILIERHDGASWLWGSRAEARVLPCLAASTAAVPPASRRPHTRIRCLTGPVVATHTRGAGRAGRQRRRGTRGGPPPACASAEEPHGLVDSAVLASSSSESTPDRGGDEVSGLRPDGVRRAPRWSSLGESSLDLSHSSGLFDSVATSSSSQYDDTESESSTDWSGRGSPVTDSSSLPCSTPSTTGSSSSSSTRGRRRSRGGTRSRHTHSSQGTPWRSPETMGTDSTRSPRQGRPITREDTRTRWPTLTEGGAAPATGHAGAHHHHNHHHHSRRRRRGRRDGRRTHLLEGLFTAAGVPWGCAPTHTLTKASSGWRPEMGTGGGDGGLAVWRLRHHRPRPPRAVASAADHRAGGDKDDNDKDNDNDKDKDDDNGHTNAPLDATDGVWVTLPCGSLHEAQAARRRLRPRQGFIPPWYAVAPRSQLLLACGDPLGQTVLELLTGPRVRRRRVGGCEASEGEAGSARPSRALAHRLRVVLSRAGALLGRLLEPLRRVAPVMGGAAKARGPPRVPLIARGAAGERLMARLRAWAAGDDADERVTEGLVPTLHTIVFSPLVHETCHTTTTGSAESDHDRTTTTTTTTTAVAAPAGPPPWRPPSAPKPATTTTATASASYGTHGLLLGGAAAAATSAAAAAAAAATVTVTSTTRGAVSRSSTFSAPAGSRLTSPNASRSGSHHHHHHHQSQSHVDSGFTASPAPHQTAANATAKTAAADARAVYERSAGVAWLHGRTPDTSATGPIVVLLLCPSIVQGGTRGHAMRRLSALCECLSAVGALAYERDAAAAAAAASERDPRSGDALRGGSDGEGGSAASVHSASAEVRAADRWRRGLRRPQYAQWYACIAAATAARREQGQASGALAESMPSGSSTAPHEGEDEGHEAWATPMTHTDVVHITGALRKRLTTTGAATRTSTTTRAGGLTAGVAHPHSATAHRRVVMIGVGWSEGAGPLLEAAIAHGSTSGLDGLFCISHTLSSRLLLLSDPVSDAVGGRPTGLVPHQPSLAPLLFHSQLLSRQGHGAARLLLLVTRLQLIAAGVHRARRQPRKAGARRSSAGEGWGVTDTDTDTATTAVAALYRARRSVDRELGGRDVATRAMVMQAAARETAGGLGAYAPTGTPSARAGTAARLPAMPSALDWGLLLPSADVRRPGTSTLATPVTVTAGGGGEGGEGLPEAATYPRPRASLLRFAAVTPLTLSVSHDLVSSPVFMRSVTPGSPTLALSPRAATTEDLAEMANLHAGEGGGGGTPFLTRAGPPAAPQRGLTRKPSTGPALTRGADASTASEAALVSAAACESGGADGKAAGGRLKVLRRATFLYEMAAAQTGGGGLSTLGSTTTATIATTMTTTPTGTTTAPLAVLGGVGGDAGGVTEVGPRADADAWQCRALEGSHAGEDTLICYPRRTLPGQPRSRRRQRPQDLTTTTTTAAATATTAATTTTAAAGPHSPPSLTPDGLQALIELRVRGAAPDVCARLSAPTLLLHASDDDVAPLSSLPLRSLQTNPFVTTVIARRGGHGVFLESVRDVWRDPRLVAVMGEEGRGGAGGATATAVGLRVEGAAWVEQLLVEFVASTVLSD